MTTQQIKWAMVHDWYIGHGINADGNMFIRVNNHGTMTDFIRYNTLRMWAGY